MSEQRAADSISECRSFLRSAANVCPNLITAGDENSAMHGCRWKVSAGRRGLMEVKSKKLGRMQDVASNFALSSACTESMPTCFRSGAASCPFTCSGVDHVGLTPSVDLLDIQCHPSEAMATAHDKHAFRRLPAAPQPEHDCTLLATDHCPIEVVFRVPDVTQRDMPETAKSESITKLN